MCQFERPLPTVSVIVPKEYVVSGEISHDVYCFVVPQGLYDVRFWNVWSS